MQHQPEISELYRFVFPENQHHDILAVGEADLVEQWPVATGNGAGGVVQRNTQLMLKAKVVFCRLHGESQSQARIRFQ